MSESDGLTNVALPDLRDLLALIEQGRLTFPLSRTNLVGAGLGHVAEAMQAVGGLDAAALLAVLRVAIAERELRPVPRLELVWTGPEARVSRSRDTAVVVRQLFEQAQRSVLIAGFRFDHGEAIFGPLYTAMKDRGVETLVFLDIEGAAPSDPEIGRYAEAAVRDFFARNWPFGEPRPRLFYDARTGLRSRRPAFTRSASWSTDLRRSSRRPTSPTAARRVTLKRAFSSKTRGSQCYSRVNGTD